MPWTSRLGLSYYPWGPLSINKLLISNAILIQRQSNSQEFLSAGTCGPSATVFKTGCYWTAAKYGTKAGTRETRPYQDSNSQLRFNVIVLIQCTTKIPRPHLLLSSLSSKGRMDFRLFGVGPGVIILVLLWSSTLLISISFGKTHGITTIIGISILSTLLSLLLIYWPIEQLEMLNSTVTEITHYDHVFIPRLLLVIFLFVVVVVVLVQYLARTVLTTVSAKSVKNRHNHGAFDEQYRIQ
ncbi:hypothetical protein V3C99_017455 [Haemonchus contortus]